MEKETLREFKAIVWFDSEPGIERLVIEAVDLQCAREFLIRKFGEEARMSVWNEKDASAPR